MIAVCGLTWNHIGKLAELPSYYQFSPYATLTPIIKPQQNTGWDFRSGYIYQVSVIFSSLLLPSFHPFFFWPFHDFTVVQFTSCFLYCCFYFWSPLFWFHTSPQEGWNFSFLGSLGGRTQSVKVLPKKTRRDASMEPFLFVYICPTWGFCCPGFQVKYFYTFLGNIEVWYALSKVVCLQRATVGTSNSSVFWTVTQTPPKIIFS